MRVGVLARTGAVLEGVVSVVQERDRKENKMERIEDQKILEMWGVGSGYCHVGVWCAVGVRSGWTLLYSCWVVQL